MTRAGARAGFSLIESVVVLAITAAILILLFGVATHGAVGGLHAAGGALAKADARVGAESLRVLLHGVRLPERGRQEAGFTGEPDSLQTAVTPSRPTACGAAPSSAVHLWLASGGDRLRLLCAQPGASQAVTLLDLGKRQAVFSYALAGRPWSDRLTVPPPSPGAGSAVQPPRPPRLWIRLATTDGAVEIVEAADPPIRAGTGV